jgi:phosphonate transport system substrate-binding protein
LILEVHPYLPATELIERFTPLALYLGEQTGRKVIVEISKDYLSHIDRIGKDQVDLAYMGPASYVKLVDNYHQKPLLARLEIDGQPFFQGIIITAANSPIHNLSDLAGKRFAFGDPESTMSHLVPRFMLINAGVDIKKLTRRGFLSNHENVALGVLVGDFDAGAVKEEVFRHFQNRGLKSLQKTPPISEHLFVTKSTLPGTMIEKLRQALCNLKNEPNGRLIMESIKEDMTGMIPAQDHDYDNLREILRALDKEGIAP